MQILRAESSYPKNLSENKHFFLLLQLKDSLVLLLQRILHRGGAAHVYLMRIYRSFFF